MNCIVCQKVINALERSQAGKGTEMSTTRGWWRRWGCDFRWSGRPDQWTFEQSPEDEEATSSANSIFPAEKHLRRKGCAWHVRGTGGRPVLLEQTDPLGECGGWSQRKQAPELCWTLKATAGASAYVRLDSTGEFQRCGDMSWLSFQKEKLIICVYLSGLFNKRQ